MSSARAFVVEAELDLNPGIDPGAAGAAVTVDLCGHWEHEGPCRWPHNSAISETLHTARFRTLYVASDEDQPAVQRRIESALRAGPGWTVLRMGPRIVLDDERELAARLLAGPRADP